MKAKVISTFKAPDGSYIQPDQEVELDQERFKYLEGANCVVKAQGSGKPAEGSSGKGRPSKSEE